MKFNKGDKVKTVNPELEHIKNETYEVEYVWDDNRYECKEVNGKGWFVEDGMFLQKVGD